MASAELRCTQAIKNEIRKKGHGILYHSATNYNTTQSSDLSTSQHQNQEKDFLKAMPPSRKWF
jgi:hypothetical protein